MYHSAALPLVSENDHQLDVTIFAGQLYAATLRHIVYRRVWFKSTIICIFDWYNTAYTKPESFAYTEEETKKE